MIIIKRTTPINKETLESVKLDVAQLTQKVDTGLKTVNNMDSVLKTIMFVEEDE